jgi:hypothetical protein
VRYTPTISISTMASDQTIHASATAPAPLEPSIAQQHQYTDRVVVDLEDHASGARTLADIVSPVLVGTGRVDLVQVIMVYKTTGPDQSVNIGQRDSANTQSASVLGLLEEGHSFTSNDRSYGSRVVVDLIPLSTTSRQIRPVSADLPTFQITWAFGGVFPRKMIVYLKVSDFRTHFIALN